MTAEMDVPVEERILQLLRHLGILKAHFAGRADPNARTNVDDFTTPLEEAESAGHQRIVDLLKGITDQR